MTTSETRDTVREVYEAYVKGDIDRVSARIGDNVDWVIHAPRPLFAFGGRHRGKQAVLDALGLIASEYEMETYVPRHMIVDGDRASVVSDVAFTQRASGRRLNFRIVDLMKLEAGKIAEFEEFIDTFDVAEQALGHHLSMA